MDTTKKQLTPAEAVKAAYDFVHPTIESLADAQACEHAYANMGQNPEDFAQRMGKTWMDSSLKHYFQSAWHQLREDSSLDSCGDIDDERRAWIQVSLKDAKLVAKAGLPLTVANCRKAFLNEAPFEKKASAKKSTKKQAKR